MWVNTLFSEKNVFVMWEELRKIRIRQCLEAE